MKKVNMSKCQKILENSTTVFLFLLPLLSTTFFYNHFTTLFEVVAIVLIFIFSIILYPESRHKIKYLLLYYLLCGIYVIFSYNHYLNFNSLVPGNFNYNIVSELLTILKLMMPITFAYSLYYQKISWNKYIKIIKMWCLLYAGTIIVTNIFKISLSSYNDKYILKSIFEWNKNNYYQDTASKGFFVYANQISLINVLLFVVLIFDFLKNNKKSLLYILILAFSMLMIGTRVSSLGGLFILIYLFLSYIIFIFLKKDKYYKKIWLLMLPLVTFIALLPISPFKNRQEEMDVAWQVNNESSENVSKIENKVKEDDDNKITYVYNHYNPSYLPATFFEKYYPIKYDSDFWYDFVKDHKDYEINYRMIEVSIIKRVKEINNDKNDFWWGISNTRIQNIVNIERDIVLHFYAFGVIGLLLFLLIYILILGHSIFSVFKLKTYHSIIYLTLISLFLLISYLTGNIINSLNAIIPFIFIISGFFERKVDI